MFKKPINKKEKLFYIIEVSTVQFSVFDSAIDIPIYVGGWSGCANVIKTLKTHFKESTILYYSVDLYSKKLKFEPLWSYNA